jgi:hypothetical protein
MLAADHKLQTRWVRREEFRPLLLHSTNSNRHKLVRLEIPVNVSKQTPEPRSNRHIWPFFYNAGALKLPLDFHLLRLKLPSPAARIVPDHRSETKQAQQKD